MEQRYEPVFQIYWYIPVFECHFDFFGVVWYVVYEKWYMSILIVLVHWHID